MHGSNGKKRKNGRSFGLAAISDKGSSRLRHMNERGEMRSVGRINNWRAYAAVLITYGVG